MTTKLVVDVAPFCDVIPVMFTGSLDHQILQAIVRLVAIDVMDVNALRKLDASLVENEAMLERVAVRARHRMTRRPNANVAARKW